MEPRLKWNKIILAAGIIFISFQTWFCATLEFFKIILFYHGTTALLSLTHAVTNWRLTILSRNTKPWILGCVECTK